MQLCPITSPPSGMNEIYVLCKQQYVLCSKYCWAYESIFIHLEPMCRNKSKKMTDSDEGW